MRSSVAAIGLALTAMVYDAGATVAASATAVESASARTSVVRMPSRLGSEADVTRYSAKHSASPDARNFRGGDDVVIVVGASTLAIVLGVILLIVLL